jgi:alpha-2-macroglobulin
MSKLWSFLRGIWVALFGRMQWEAPGWLKFGGRKIKAGGGWARGHKGAAAGILVGIAALSVGGVYGVKWWKARPRPVETTVTITAPELTRVKEKIEPYPVLIDFDGSAAPLKNVGKVVTTGIEISPKVEGVWKWESDRQLSFAPKADWPIGQEYTVKLAKKELIAAHVTLDKYKLTFSTASFNVRLSESEFYQDPVDPNLKKVVATFAFTHPVDPAQFEKRLKLRLEPTDKQDKAVDYKFRVSYDRFKTNAYVHSEPVTIPSKDAHMVITLGSGTRAAKGGPEYEQKIEEKVKVPGLYNFLKVNTARLTIVDNEKFEPEQVLVLETSAGISESEMQKNVQAWLLPVYNPDDAEEHKRKRPHHWGNAEEIGEPLLKKSQAIKLTQVASEKEYATLHSFKLQAPVGRWIYVQVKKGMRAFGGYVLGDTFQATQRVGEYPRQLRILHSGALLSMSGEKKVSVFARDVPAVRVEIGRILPDQLHHLFTQAGGPFAHPYFNYNFGEENLSEYFTDVRDLGGRAPGKPQYEAIDLGKYVTSRGVFLLKVQSWNKQGNHGLGEQDQRLILVSDLGLIVKDAADGTHDLFVQSIHTGEPVSGARIQVLGKNGQPIATDTTNSEGRANLPSLSDYKREKQPTGYVVQKGRDLSFLPFGRGDRALDMSRFDVGGVTESGNPKALTAYVFSDRGIYRPGDEIRVGLIVRSRDWREKLDGIPLQVVINDARGLTVRKEAIKLDAVGFSEVRHTTAEVSPTGTYTVNVHVVKDGRPANLLGSTTVRVREFMPDKMKISVKLSAENPEGWVSPVGLKGRVTLANLIGTPATGRKVRGSLHLTPALPHFGKWKDYKFFDPMRARESFNDTLADAETNNEGVAEIDLGLQKFAAATYRLSFLAEGYEAEGGRGVAGEASAIVSPLPYLIGFKPDGELRYLSKDSAHSVDLIAVGPRGDRMEVKGLRAMLYERKFVSVLTRQDNGTYKYDSVKREIEATSKPLEIAAKGTKIPVNTAKPGDYTIIIKNAKDEELQRIEFSVAGSGNLSRSMDKNAELQLALKKTDIEAGDELEVSIKAPFVGAGLITVEREKVFTHKWFKTSETATVQKIKVPSDFEGDGYLSVSFVRDPGSDEIFMSPLSYGVVPFSVSRGKRVVDIKVQSSDLARPGEPYKIKVSTEKPTRLVMMAVDEGILRVADHKTPDPIAFFFQKRALGVRTLQILDLILPEHSKLLSALAPGGDDEAGALGAHLNPFKRKQQKPVAYWSGIIEVGPKEKELTYEVPDYFNGTLRLMAIAVAEDAIGTFEKKAVIRGDFTINPNVPLVAAPGDEFEVSVSVSNNVVGSGKGAGVELALKTSKHLEVQGGTSQKISIDELREGSAKFKLKATSVLGSGSLTFTASLSGKSGKLSTDISVRPAAPYLSTFQAGHLKEGDVSAPVQRKLYSEYRQLKAGISHLPLGLTHGLASYLEKYPHGCTEQIVSQTVPAIALGKHKDFGMSTHDAAKSVSTAIATLRTRQNDEGGFGLWAANPRVQPITSVYTLHVLTEAKERGYGVPADMLKNGMAWLQTQARETGDSIGDARVRAYAIYVLTRNGMVTSAFASGLQKYLDANHPKTWRKDLAGAYLASTYALLRQEKLARAIIEEQRLGVSGADDYAYLYDGLAHDAQLLYLLAKHFPDRAAKITPAELNAMVEPIFRGSYNTFSSAHAILALEAYGEAAGKQSDGAMAIKEVIAGQKKNITLPAGLLPLVDFSDQAGSIEFSSSGPFGAYWMVNQKGFDIELPKKQIATKVEVFREYTDDKGKVIDKVVLGEEVQVHVRMRALGKDIGDLAVVDLLPGGFEVVMQEPVRSDDSGTDRAERGDDPPEGSGEEVEGSGDEVPSDGEGEGDHGGDGDGDSGGSAFALPISIDGSTFTPDYGDVREDRVVLFGAVGKDAVQFVYVIKATNVGTYTVPPIMAESMYDRSVVARGVGGKIVVVPR